MVVEKHAVAKFDEVASAVATKMGIREIPWYSVTLYLTIFYTVITLLTLFSRVDILNVNFKNLVDNYSSLYVQWPFT